RVATRHDAAADEEVEIAVTVEVARCDDAAAVGVRRHGVGGARELAAALVAVNPVAQALVPGLDLRAAADDVQVQVAVRIEIEPEGTEILGARVVVPGP